MQTLSDEAGLDDLEDSLRALAELITISALAKATGDIFTYGLTKRLLTSMKIGRVGRDG